MAGCLLVLQIANLYVAIPRIDGHGQAYALGSQGDGGVVGAGLNQGAKHIKAEVIGVVEIGLANADALELARASATERDFKILPAAGLGHRGGDVVVHKAQAVPAAVGKEPDTAEVVAGALDGLQLGVLQICGQ